MSKSKVERVEREIIENKLLLALDDDSKVAIVLNENDLNDLIHALELVINIIKGDGVLKDSLRGMLEDMNTLQQGAFPE